MTLIGESISLKLSMSDRTAFKHRSLLIPPCKLGLALYLIAVLACMPGFAHASSELVERINIFRATPGQCAEVHRAPATPLSPDATLAQVKLEKGMDLRQALKNAGYLAARAEAILISGPSSVAAAMKAITDRYCRILTEPEYASIGISREGNTWRIVLAKPLLTIDLSNAAETGRRVLALVNAARKITRTCGGKRFPAAQPVVWNDKLAHAALAHSRDMALHNYFSHKAQDGSQVDVRARRTGYRWSMIGENIAAGQGSAEEAMAGWLASPGHCSIIMNSGFTEMGAAYAVNGSSDKSIYWTQVFGTPR